MSNKISFKFDEYRIKESGKEYSVLLFPKVQYMWAFDYRTEEDCYMIDGPIYAFKLLKLACAILIEASDKIIYFPCKQASVGPWYEENFNFVMCTPKVQLRRSKWVSIRKKICKANYIGKYKLSYNRKKLDDYFQSELLDLEKTKFSMWKYTLKTEYDKKIRKDHMEEVVGDTLFWILDKEECYLNHYRIGIDMDNYHDLDDYGAWSSFGWIITKTGFIRMQERAKQAALEEEKRRALFDECIFIE